MAEKSVSFRLVKCIYVIILVMGLIGSTVLFVIGLYALNDTDDNSKLYENIMKYYGIDELNFEPVFNDTNLYHMNHSLSDDNLTKQNFFGTIMVFVGVVSVIFELIGLIGAVRENLVVTLTILILMIVGTISGLFTIKTIDLCTIVTQTFFIVLAAVYVYLLKRELTRDRASRRAANADLEMNRNAGAVKPSQSADKFITINGPPPYVEVDHLHKSHL